MSKIVDRNSKIKDIYANPIGHDILAKLLLSMGKNDSIVKNPFVGNLKIGALERLFAGRISAQFIDTVLELLNSEPDVPLTSNEEEKPAWWKEAVFYQIYPQSFCDANGDGIGDLKGIISKLDYLKDLGINALWLSPIYDSPWDDNGYDIRDYMKISERFGTMEEFDTLLSEVHKRDMHLIMDLVINHTSDEHMWYKRALSEPGSKYRDYYIFRTSSGKEPNNWTSFFSGSAWNQVDEDTWALHLFSKKQMDLNWESKELRKEVITMINSWLDKGVDGFRMDVINLISKKEGLPNGDPMVGKMMGIRGIENYFYGPKLHSYLREINEKAFKPHNAFSVGETPGLGMEMCKLVTGEERGELNMVFSFDFLETPGHTRFEEYVYDLNYYRDFIIDWATHYGTNHRMSLFYNNHDNPKMISKIDPTGRYRKEIAKLLCVMQFTLPGTPFMFQGDEMGLENYDFSSIDEIEDIESKNYYKELIKKMSCEEAFKIILAGTREHGRVLLPWNENAPKKQEILTDVTDLYKTMIALRKGEKALLYGNFVTIRKKSCIFTYERGFKNHKYIVDLNLGVDIKRGHKVSSGFECVLSSGEDTKILEPYGWKVYRQKR